METILMIKRLPTNIYQGDKTWQVAPYPICDKAHAERIVAWLKQTAMKECPFEHKVINA